ncbi:MAG: glycosyltransferase family 39 protein [Acidobacteria bacterium]|nr:glycosyltransferase family 39 protein [Acidobacteriota bacterium]MBV9144416.1 glycosyltransferase family 39 protein [Acidobacteriota bacterium]MBV9434983.1 glycosyltransferase family 39 protein [Acidobacteriota bacterium]
MPALSIDFASSLSDTRVMSVAAVEPPSPAKSHRKLYWLILCVGFALRFGFVLWTKTYVQRPGAIYPYALEVSSIAAHLARGQGFSSPFLHDTGPTAWIAPIYPCIVALVFRLFGIYTSASALLLLGLQCLMAAATGIAIYRLGSRTLGPKIGMWSAWIWTVSPIFFRWPASWIWDFAASALLLATILNVTLSAAERGRTKDWMFLGILWGITALTNPALLSILPFSYGYAFLAGKRPYRAKKAIYSAALCLLLIMPWAIRNDVVFGHPVFLRSNFWFEFHLGNYHYSNGMGYFGFHPGSNPRELDRYEQLGEQGYIRWARAQALNFVHKYPREFLQLTLHRTLWFWDGTPLIYQAQEWWQPWEFWPFSAAAWLGLIFLLTRRPRGWALFAACLIVYPIPYYLVYPVAKYRYALEPEMLLLCVFLASVLLKELVRQHVRAKINNLRRSA